MKFNLVNYPNNLVTCHQGKIRTGYAKLVKAFGEPNSAGDGYKTDAEWIIRFEDGTIATIYNYKDGKNYCGAEGHEVKDITDWHIGGEGRIAAHYVKSTVGTQS